MQPFWRGSGVSTMMSVNIDIIFIENPDNRELQIWSRTENGWDLKITPPGTKGRRGFRKKIIYQRPVAVPENLCSNKCMCIIVLNLTQLASGINQVYSGLPLSATDCIVHISLVTIKDSSALRETLKRITKNRNIMPCFHIILQNAL